MANNISKHNINDLRDRLFDVLDQVKDGTMDLEYAKVVALISQTIINASKVEMENTKNVGGAGTNFFPILDAEFKVISSESTDSSDEPKRLNR